MANITPTEPGYDAVAVTPSDTGAISARSLYIGGAGHIKIVTAAGRTVTFVGLVAGQILPVRATRVFSTDTTATNIVAIL